MTVFDKLSTFSPVVFLTTEKISAKNFLLTSKFPPLNRPAAGKNPEKIEKILKKGLIL